jgi:hypothetical protein
VLLLLMLVVAGRRERGRLVLRVPIHVTLSRQ